MVQGQKKEGDEKFSRFFLAYCEERKERGERAGRTRRPNELGANRVIL